MKTVLVTGAAGFIGRNLVTALQRVEGLTVQTQTSNDPPEDLEQKVLSADLVFHLAGANRPTNEADFQRVNADLTARVAQTLAEHKHPAGVVYSSSTQVTRDNPYGHSKKAAEECLEKLANEAGNPVSIYRLPNVFGKWSRPHYNSVVATFCHQIARNQPIKISDRSYELTLVYVDEVVRCFLRHLDPAHNWELQASVDETHNIQLGDLADRIEQFRDVRQSLLIPDVSDKLTRYLYSTYLSFLPEDDFGYPVHLRTDDRGWLFELAKSGPFGQIFVSTTKPGITRGNHYHDTKIEKFCLIQGKGMIRFRDLESDDIIEYPVDDQQIRIVDIPPGYTHSIENVGDTSMVVLFWANEVFNPDKPDTYWIPVLTD